MGTGAPLDVPKGTRGQIFAWIRLFFLAVAYILLVPVVSVAVLWAGVTYFPEPTKNFLGPIVKRVIPELNTEAMVAEQVQSEFSSLKTNLAQITEDVSALAERLSVLEKMSEFSQSEGQTENGAKTNFISLEIARKTKLLAALASLTAARMEYLQGNKGLALREVRATQDILADMEGISQEFDDMLANSASEISKDSPQAQDWLSLSWHRLLQDITTEGVVKPGETSQ